MAKPGPDGTIQQENDSEIQNEEHDHDALAKRVVMVDGEGNIGNKTIIIDEDGDAADVIQTDDLNGLVTVTPGHVSTLNSTATPLDADAIYTGGWEDVTNYGIIVITINSSHDSAADGLMVEFSSDGTNVDSDDVFTIPANTGKTFSFQAATKYYRVKYTNGSTQQTHFRLQTILKPYYVKPSSHRINDSIIGEDDAELVKAVLTGENPAETFVNFKATTAGNFKVSLEELESGVSVNANSQLKVTVFDSSGNEVGVAQLVDDDTNIDGEQAWVTAASAFGRINADKVKPMRMDASTHTLQTIDYEHHEIHSNSHYWIADYTTLGNNDVLDFCLETPDNDKFAHLVFNYSSNLLLTADLYENSDYDDDGTIVAQKANNRALTYSGGHTGGTSATVMTDSTASFTVDALIGWKIHNTTDGSWGIVTDNDATTVTVASLTGGTDNDWDLNDRYEINRSLLIIQVGATVNSLGDKLSGSKGGTGTNPSRARPGASERNKEIVLRPNTKYIARFTSGAADNVISYNAEWYEHTDKD